jgi:hypothetical protein
MLRCLFASLCLLASLTQNASANTASDTRKLFNIAARRDEARAGKAVAGPASAFFTRLDKGQLRTSLVDDVATLKQACPKCVSYDNRHFYESVALMNRAVVDACRNTATRASAARVGESAFACRSRPWPLRDDTRGEPYRYVLLDREDGLHIYQRIRFELHPEAEVTAKDLADAIDSAVGSIRSFWARYGIRYDLDYDTDRSPKPQPPYFTIRMWSRAGIADAFNMYFFGLGQNKRRDLLQSELTQTLRHELGHRLSLPDLYEDRKNCPDRAFIDNYLGTPDMMNYEFVNTAEFSPWEIAQIIAPICSK